MKHIDQPEKQISIVYCAILYTAIALAATLPFFLQPGFVFLLDMSWVPHARLDLLFETIKPHLPVSLLLHTLITLFGAAFIQKVLLTFILLLPGITMHILLKQHHGNLLCFTGGILYMLNPFVYERFIAGQWLVLLGYGLLPIMFIAWHKLLDQNTSRKTQIFSVVALSTYPIISIHFSYLFAFYILTSLLLFLYTSKEKLSALLHTSRVVMSAFAVTVLVNLFWILPKNNQVFGGRSITWDDFYTFRTLIDESVGIWPTVINLYGFWQSDVSVPKDSLIGWWLIGLCLLVLSLYGLIKAIRQRNTTTASISILLVLGLLFGAGYSSDLSAWSINYGFHYLPGFGGLRDTAKALGLVAFSYSVLGIYGISTLARTRSRNTLCALVVCLSTISVWPMFFGFNGAIAVTEYPDSWYEVNTLLKKSPTETTLVFPWEGYLKVSFARDTFVANPTKQFFQTNILQGNHVDGNDLVYASERNFLDLSAAIISGEKVVDTEWQNVFTEHNIQHVLLINEGENFTIYQEALSNSNLFNKVYISDEIHLYEIK